MSPAEVFARWADHWTDDVQALERDAVAMDAEYPEAAKRLRQWRRDLLAFALTVARAELGGIELDRRAK